MKSPAKFTTIWYFISLLILVAAQVPYPAVLNFAAISRENSGADKGV